MSSSIAHARASNKRTYRLRKRAEKQDQTRQRIVEAAVELHGKLGPAHTSVAQIAARAGVQRHTFYAHFPDDRSLWLACSGHAMARDPLPDVDAWTGIPAGSGRIQHALEQLYAWYERNEQLVAAIVRDAEMHELTREIVDMRMGPTFAAAAALLGQGLGEEGRALLGVALDFACWRVLRRTMSNGEAAALMSRSIVSFA